MVCLAFGQKVCGFDLLRSERGKSYVCDVNGWSFVKNSDKVCFKCSHLAQPLLHVLQSHLLLFVAALCWSFLLVVVAHLDNTLVPASRSYCFHTVATHGFQESFSNKCMTCGTDL